MDDPNTTELGQTEAQAEVTPIGDNSRGGTGAAATLPIAHEDELKGAIPAPSTEKDTHVLVPNTHVDFLHRLVDDVEQGVEGASAALVRAFRRVFSDAA